MNPVFLSASEPDPTRRPEYWDSRKLLNVREAVRALTAYVLPRGPLVFGGHPAITPLVDAIAERIRHDAQRPRYEKDRQRREPPERHSSVVLRFLSRHFASRFSHDAVALENTVLSPAVDERGDLAPDDTGSRRMSLLLMRYAMIGKTAPGPCVSGFERHRHMFGRDRGQRLGTEEFSAGIFIGGMEGVEREFNIFRHLHPTAPAWPIASTGSACAGLLERLRLPASQAVLLREETTYDLLMERLFETAESYRAAPPPPFRDGDHLDPPDIR